MRHVLPIAICSKLHVAFLCALHDGDDDDENDDDNNNGDGNTSDADSFVGWRKLKLCRILKFEGVTQLSNFEI